MATRLTDQLSGKSEIQVCAQAPVFFTLLTLLKTLASAESLKVA